MSQGLRHGPAIYNHPNGNKEEATYVEGYEEVGQWRGVGADAEGAMI